MSAENKELNDKIEQAKYNYDLVNSWIENADNKVSVSCGIFTGVFGVLTFLSERVSTTNNINACWQSFYKWSRLLGLIAMAFSIFMYVLAINPNLGSSGKKKGKSDKKYPLYFGDIAKLGEQGYKDKIKNSSDENLYDELLTETQYNADICDRKMKKYRTGLWISLIAVGLAFFSLAARYFMYS